MRESIDFTDSVVVVTGGASDVGKSIVNEFTKEGAAVVVADIDDERGRSVARQARENHGQETAFVLTDVSSLGECEDLVSEVEDRFGRLDVLVNAAAVAAPEIISKPFLDEEPSDWKPQLQVTFMGAVNATHASLPLMIDTGGGSIINFSSEAHRGQDRRLAVYSAAKSGVTTFTRTLAKEIGKDGVRINAISPSATRTAATETWLDDHGDAVVKEHALDRLGRPEDHANAALFLASDAAGWITGETLSVNGGYL